MLVVIFLSCHCSLLCSPSFLIILSAIYQTMKSERKKKWTCRFFALWLMSSFLRKNVLCVLSFCAVKKSLLSVEIIQLFFFFVVFIVSFNSQKGFSVVSKLLSWEKPKSMHFSGSCKRDVCLFDNTSKSVTGWDLKSTKNAGFPISTTDCTYAFCTSGIFYTGD